MQRAVRRRFPLDLTRLQRFSTKSIGKDLLGSNKPWDSTDFADVQAIWLRQFNQPNQFELFHIALRWMQERGKTQDNSYDDFLRQIPRFLMICKRKRAHQPAERLIQAWNNLYVQMNSDQLRPSDQAFSITFDILAQKAWDPGKRKQVESLIELSRSNGHAPDDRLWDAALRALANCSPYEDGIPKLIEGYIEKNYFVPNDRTWSALVLAHSRDKDPDGLNRAVSLVRRLVRENRGNRVFFNLCLDALGRQGRAKEAEALLGELMRVHQEASPKEYQKRLEPCDRSFLAVINAWAKSKSTLASQSARRLLSLAERLQDKYEDVRVTLQIATAVLECCAQSPQPGPVVQEVLEDMINMNHKLASVPAFTIAIHAWSRTKSPEAPLQANCLLESLEASENIGMRPNVIAYTATIQAWAHSDHQDAWTMVAGILSRMRERKETQPNVVTYNVLLDARAKRGQAVEARELLNEMQEQGILPNATSYGSLMQAYNKHGPKEFAIQASAILAIMEEQADRGNRDASPNNLVYSTAIAALGMSGLVDGAEQADAIFWRWVKKGSPNISIHVPSATLLAWSRSRDATAVDHAEAIFSWIMDHNLKPTRSVYNYMLATLGKSERRNSWKRIGELIEQMEQTKTPPDEGAFRRLMYSLRMSDCPMKSRRCLDAARKLQNDTPDSSRTRIFELEWFRSVLVACETSPKSDREEVLQVLEELFKIQQNDILEAERSEAQTMLFSTCQALSVDHEKWRE